MRTHDDWAINGQWHYCEKCNTRWSDADGGCECEEEEEEEEEEEDV